MHRLVLLYVPENLLMAPDELLLETVDTILDDLLPSYRVWQGMVVQEHCSAFNVRNTPN